MNWLNIAIFVEDFDLHSPNQCNLNFVEYYAGRYAHSQTRKSCSTVPSPFYSGESTIFLRFFAKNWEHAVKSNFKLLFSTYVYGITTLLIYVPNWFKGCTCLGKYCNRTTSFPCDDDTCIPKGIHPLKLF